MRRLGVAVLVMALLLFPGCCASVSAVHPDTNVSIGSYVKALKKIKENVATMRGDHETALGLVQPPYVPELVEAELGLYDTTNMLCDDALNGTEDAAPAAAPAPEGGTE